MNNSSPQSLREVWRWKDVALGDGRDYFIPRPRAISDFQSLFLRNDYAPSKIDESFPTNIQVCVEECSILSNCARLDIYLSLRTMSAKFRDKISTNENGIKSYDWIELEAKRIAAYVLANQLKNYQDSKSKRSILSESISTFLDLPGVIQTENRSLESSSMKSEDPETYSIINQLANSLHVSSGVENVTRHACLVAAGMKDRPSRPGRKVPFRPFSSRDAHVMLQMKRTVEVSDINICRKFFTLNSFFSNLVHVTNRYARGVSSKQCYRQLCKPEKQLGILRKFQKFCR